MKLSVIVLTYNHEKFIRKTLEGILAQQVNFEMEVIISDDGSTDKTVDIINEIRNKTSIKFITIFNQTNKGVLKNALGIFDKISGDYLAVVDGDDYWNNEEKIQQQVNFLENNPDYSGCFHDAAIISDEEASNILFNNSTKYSDTHKYAKEVYPADILKRLILPTSSLVLRTDFLKNIDFSILKDNYSIVWKLTCFAILKSKFFYFDNAWSTYRNHKKGISKSNNVGFHKSHIAFLNTLTKREEFRPHLYDIYSSLSNEYRLVIEREPNKNNALKRIFLSYLLNEVRKNHQLYRFIFKNK